MNLEYRRVVNAHKGSRTFRDEFGGYTRTKGCLSDGHVLSKTQTGRQNMVCIGTTFWSMSYSEDDRVD